MIVVDSSVWIDLFRSRRNPPQATVARWLSRGAPIAVTDVIYMELLRGVRHDAEADALRRLIRQTTILRLRSLRDFELAADLFRRVSRSGQTVRQSTDCMIAAVCIREDVPLLHNDVDFDRIADVSELQVA